MDYRIEKDSLGAVKIPKNKLWGAQSQRSLENFKIGQNTMPLELIKALALIKEGAAHINNTLGLLEDKKTIGIKKAAQEIQSGLLNQHFPLTVWQTGSGTQSNMNVNEVIANRAIQLAGGQIGDKSIHPNDDVNKSQSSNDTIPSAMRIALYLFTQKNLLPAIDHFKNTLDQKSQEFKPFIKTGRTHLMDAVPLSLGQEFLAFHQQITFASEVLKNKLSYLLELPLGGTAIGTGLNSPSQFGEKVCHFIKEKTKTPFKVADNKFAKISAHNSILELSGSFKTLSVVLTKIANDIRLLASGPRSGLGELLIPANEPGSSIMPGKVNPTQCEALSMLCAQVIGQDLSLSLGAMGGHLQLNAYKPLIFFNSLQSARLLTDGLNNFTDKCLKGLKANPQRIKQHLENNLMLITALNPHIGYDKSAQIAKIAQQQGLSLKTAAIKSGFVTEKEFEEWVDPKNMISVD